MSNIDQAAIDITYARVKLFLHDHRHRRGDRRWFTVADIAADFGKRLPIVPLILALRDLARSSSLEGDSQGRVRHA